jgi:hypothetical protein
MSRNSLSRFDCTLDWGRVTGASFVIWACAVVFAVPALAQTGPAVSDSFNRANSSTLGIADTGQPWTIHAGDAYISSGTAAFGTGFVLTSLDAGTSEGVVQVLVSAPADEFWLILRMENTANYWRFGRWRGETYQLQQVIGNNIGNPQLQNLATMSPVVGDVLRCVLSTTSIECSVNGVVVVSTPDMFAASATRMGLSGYLASSVRFDDFSVAAPGPIPDVAVRLTGPVSTYPGRPVSWTATVENRGGAPAAIPELIVDPPEAHTVQIAGATCSSSGTSYRCSLPTLDPQEVVTLDIETPSVSPVSFLTVTATVPAVAGETDTSRNSASFTTQVKAPLPADTRVFDTFDRPNGTVLSISDSGHAWTHHANPVTINTGQAVTGTGFSLTTINPGTPITKSSVTVAQPGSELWLIVRFQNDSNYWRFGRWRGEAYELQRIVAGNLGTPAITRFATLIPAAGDVIACDATQAALECSVNGTPVARTTETGGNTATRAGLSAYLSDTLRFDDFLITGPPPPPNLAIKLAGPVLTNANVVASWTATAMNLAEITADSVEIVITPPAEVSQVSITGSSCAPAGSSWTCAVGNLRPGQTASIRLDAVTPINGGRITVTASVPVRAGEAQAADNSKAFVTTVRSATNDNIQLYDAFDRPDASELGTAATGQSWSAVSSAFFIRSGVAAVGDGYALASIDAESSAINASVAIVNPGSEFWLVFRFQDSQNYWRFGRWHDEQYQLQSIRDGNLASPAVEVLATMQSAAGDALNCNVSITGIECSVNGTVVVRTTDPASRFATRVGLAAYNSGTVRFDDLLVVGPPPAPNVAVTVNGRRNVMTSESHVVEVVAGNAGRVTSASGTLVVTLSPSLVVASAPSECLQEGSAFTCTLPALASSAEQRYLFTVSSTDPGTFSSRAEAFTEGESVPSDNVFNWTITVHALGAASVIDRFDRADTSSGLGTTPTQQVWNDLSAGFHISGGQARAESGGAVAMLYPGFSFGTIDVVLGSNASTTGVLFRIADANNYYRLAADEEGYYGLRKVVNGVVQPLAFGYTRAYVQPAAGDAVRVVTRPDDGIFVAVNGQQILDFGDPMFMHASGWGIASVNGPAAVDEIFVNPRMQGYITTDNFELPDGSPLEQPTTGAKYFWRPWLGDAWVAASGRARPTSDSYTYTWVDTSTEQATVSVKVMQHGAGAWLLFRFDEITNTYFRFGQNDGTYRVQFMAHENPAEMPVSVEALASPAPQPGDLLKVQQRPDGTVECSVNGVITHRFVDNVTNFRWTLNGIGADGTGAALDDFEVIP